VHGVLSAVGLL